jgi:hypothetical protein
MGYNEHNQTPDPEPSGVPENAQPAQAYLEALRALADARAGLGDKLEAERRADEAWAKLEAFQSLLDAKEKK